MAKRNAYAMRRVAMRFCVMILACVLAQSAYAQAIGRAQDLARSAREAADARVPLLVFFSEPGCPYCDQARRDYLGPMGVDPQTRATLRIVEVDITSAAPLIDYAGRRTTHSAFARTQRVRLVPVVAFVGARGETLADRLVGLTVPGFYQGSLDRRIEQARGRIAAPAR
jgi:thioredoxin-related protein